MLQLRGEVKAMLETLEQTGQVEIKVAGKSWVIQLPADFATENNLPAKTQVLLTRHLS